MFIISSAVNIEYVEYKLLCHKYRNNQGHRL